MCHFTFPSSTTGYHQLEYVSQLRHLMTTSWNAPNRRLQLHVLLPSPRSHTFTRPNLLYYILRKYKAPPYCSFSFRRVRKISKSNYWLRHVRLSSWYNSAPAGRILITFYIWRFFENLLRIFKFHYNLTRKTGILHKDQRKFMTISRSVLLRVRNVSDKNCREHHNKHFISNDFYFPKIVSFIRQCGKTWYSQTEHRWQTITRRNVANCMRNNQGNNTGNNISYLLLLHCNNGYANAPQCWYFIYKAI
jgi:hypothetical protein